MNSQALGSEEDLENNSNVSDFGKIPQYSVKRMSLEESDYDIITQSNLFHPERIFIPVNTSESAAPTPTSKQASKEITNLRLLGTIVINKKNSFALIVDNKDKNSKGKPIQYKVGDSIGEYTLAQVLSDRVVLLKDEELAILKLKAQKGKRRKGRGSSRNRNRYTKSGKPNHRNSSSRNPEYKKDERRERGGITSRSTRSRSHKKSNRSRSGVSRSGVRGSSNRRTMMEGSSKTGRRSRYSCGG